MQTELVIFSFILAPNFKQKFRMPSVAKKLEFGEKYSRTFIPSLSFLQLCNGFQLENEGLARRDSLESYLSDLALSDKKGRKWKKEAK